MGKKMKKQNRKKHQGVGNNSVDQSFAEANIRFIVPMPGKSSWYSSKNELTFKKIHQTKAIASDFALEDYQAQFLMQRDYLID